MITEMTTLQGAEAVHHRNVENHPQILKILNIRCQSDKGHSQSNSPGAFLEQLSELHLTTNTCAQTNPRSSSWTPRMGGQPQSIKSSFMSTTTGALLESWGGFLHHEAFASNFRNEDESCPFPIAESQPLVEKTGMPKSQGICQISSGF